MFKYTNCYITCVNKIIHLILLFKYQNYLKVLHLTKKKDFLGKIVTYP